MLSASGLFGLYCCTLWLHFLSVPSAPGRSLRCWKHPVRHWSRTRHLTLFTHFLWTWQLSWVWQSRVYPDYKALYLGFETHFWLDSWTVQTTRPSYRSPSTAPFTVTVTVTVSHSCSLHLALLGLPVSRSGRSPDYPLHLNLRLWTFSRLLPYLESL